MKLLFNELSIDGQFTDLESFRLAVDKIMSIRRLARRYGRELQCHQSIAQRKVTHDLFMQQAVNRALSQAKRSAFLQWLTRHGPFWGDERMHGDDDYMVLARDDTLVTESAVGEAAYRLFHDIACGVVSMEHPAWVYSPVAVNWHRNEMPQSIDVGNYWNSVQVETALQDAPAPPLNSWEDLESMAKACCPNLAFSSGAFMPLHEQGVPFNESAANQLLQRLTVLRDLKNSSDAAGEYTPQGHEIIQTHFMGDNAWFSDSSDTEKSKFRKELSFRHPKPDGGVLFCTWHGKVKYCQLRIHFSWPVHANRETHVVYVGPKITRK